MTIHIKKHDAKLRTSMFVHFCPPITKLWKVGPSKDIEYHIFYSHPKQLVLFIIVYKYTKYLSLNLQI